MKEKSALIGIAVGLVLIYGSIFMGKGWQTFFDIPSLVVVLGGTAAAQLVSYTFKELAGLPEALRNFAQFEEPDFTTYISRFSNYSRMARREGVLALDQELENIEDEFMCTGLEMAIDGLEAEEIQEMMELKIREEMKQRKFGSSFFINAGTYAPAFGMIGTLIGLIQMLQNLSDPSQIGQGMSTALVTTFYGALFANLIFLPLAGKLDTQRQAVRQIRSVTLTGILSIVRGESPTVIERKLNLYLPDNNDQEAGEADDPPLSRAA